MLPDLDIARVQRWADRLDNEMEPHVRQEVRYDLAAPTPHVDPLTGLVDNDHSGLLWG